jgi:shikimate kinase
VTKPDPLPSKPIALIGCRGSGKTCVAREVAAQIGRHVVDTDELVAARRGRSITEIFNDEGESVFRRYESETIAGVLQDPPGIISVGGGAVLDPENVRRLRDACFVVWLVAPPEVLWDRVRTDEASASSRPPLTSAGGLAEVRRVLADREDLYREAAHATVETTAQTPQDVARAVIRLARGARRA